MLKSRTGLTHSRWLTPLPDREAQGRQIVHGSLLLAPLVFLVRRDGPLLPPLERPYAVTSGDERLFGGLELDPAILGVGLGPHQLATQGTNPIPMPDHVGDRSTGRVERRGARRPGVERRLRVGERLRGTVGNDARFGH